MSNSNPTLSRGDQYVVFYVGGAYDGQTDTRISTDGSWDDELTVIAAVTGKETQLVYISPVAVQVGDEVHVTYTWDQRDSDPIEALDERTELDGSDS
jgi:hypothetical protein